MIVHVYNTCTYILTADRHGCCGASQKTSTGTHLYVFLGDDVEDFGAVCEQALDDLQHIVSELSHAQLVDEHLQPFLRGKHAAVLATTADHCGK